MAFTQSTRMQTSSTLLAQTACAASVQFHDRSTASYTAAYMALVEHNHDIRGAWCKTYVNSAKNDCNTYMI